MRPRGAGAFEALECRAAREAGEERALALVAVEAVAGEHELLERTPRFAEHLGERRRRLPRDRRRLFHVHRRRLQDDLPHEERCPRGRERGPTLGLLSTAFTRSACCRISHWQERTRTVQKSTTRVGCLFRRFQPLGAPAAIPTFCRCMIGVRAGASVDRSACKAPAQTRRRPSVRARGDAENRVLACAKLVPVDLPTRDCRGLDESAVRF